MKVKGTACPVPGWGAGIGTLAGGREEQERVGKAGGAGQRAWRAS